MTFASLLNGPIEGGLRALVLLLEAYPKKLDIQILVALDYMMIHSGDVDGGPQSLHPPGPLRAGEIAVRRKILEEGLRLYQARGLIAQVYSEQGLQYFAEDFAAAFLDSLTTNYVKQLRNRAKWVWGRLGHLCEREIDSILTDSLGRWREEFLALAIEEDCE